MGGCGWVWVWVGVGVREEEGGCKRADKMLHAAIVTESYFL